MLANITLPSKEQAVVTAENEQAIRSLAIEMARGINDSDEILERFSLSKEDFEHIARSRMFQSLLEQAVKEWGSASNTAERVKIKTQALIEEALPAMFAELRDDKHPLSSRADLFGRLARIGALGNAPAGAGNTGDVFKININLGDDKHIAIEHSLPTKVIEGDYEEL